MAPSFNFNTLYRESKGNDRMDNILGIGKARRNSQVFFCFCGTVLKLKTFIQ